MALSNLHPMALGSKNAYLEADTHRLCALPCNDGTISQEGEASGQRVFLAVGVSLAVQTVIFRRVSGALNVITNIAANLAEFTRRYSLARESTFCASVSRNWIGHKICGRIVHDGISCFSPDA